MSFFFFHAIVGQIRTISQNVQHIPHVAYTREQAYKGLHNISRQYVPTTRTVTRVHCTFVMSVCYRVTTRTVYLRKEKLSMNLLNLLVMK